MKDAPLKEVEGCRPSSWKYWKRSLFNATLVTLAASISPAAALGGGVASNCWKGRLRDKKIVTGLSTALASCWEALVSLKM